MNFNFLRTNICLVAFWRILCSAHLPLLDMMTPKCLWLSTWFQFSELNFRFIGFMFCRNEITIYSVFWGLKSTSHCFDQLSKTWRLYSPFLWYRGFYDSAVFILSVPMHCSATHRFFYLYQYSKHNSHIYRNVWSFCPNVLNFCKYTYFYLRNSGHFYFTLIPCFVKCPIIKP